MLFANVTRKIVIYCLCYHAGSAGRVVTAIHHALASYAIRVGFTLALVLCSTGSAIIAFVSVQSVTG